MNNVNDFVFDVIMILSIFRLVNSFFHQFINMIIVPKLNPVIILLMVSTAIHCVHVVMVTILVSG